MEEKDRKTIKTIGIIVIAISALIAFGNLMGSLTFIIIGGFKSTGSNPGENLDIGFVIWNYYLVICFGTIILAIINIIGGIGLTKFRRWGRKVVIINSALFIFLMVMISVTMIILSKGYFGAVGVLMPLISMLIFLTPFILLIRYLTRDKIKTYFA